MIEPGHMAEQDEKSAPPPVTGKATYAARARTHPKGDVWFTIGQAWEFDEDGRSGLTVRLAMTPTNWDGELHLLPIPEES